MAIDPIKKSSRLLQSRRYTLDTLADGQEAFTQVLDLGSSEIYSQTNLIPSASLPFSGSSQAGATSGVLKFWYRQRLTRGVESDGRQVWFFLDPFAASADSQTIQTSQVTNFISPKYSIPPLAASNTEISTPGYLATVRTSTNGVTFSDPINTNFYAFDYKTGVLQFSSSGVTPVSGDVYISVYQYTGRTLASDAILGYSGSFSGSFQGNGAGLTNLPASSIVGLNLTQIADSQVSASVSTTGTSFTVSSASINLLTVNNQGLVSASLFSGSFVGNSNTTGSFTGIGSGSFSGSFQGNGNGLTNVPASSIVGLNLSLVSTGSVTASTAPNGTVFQITSGSSTLLSLNSLGDLTVSASEFIGNNLTAVGNAAITGSLTAKGNTSLEQNLTVGGTTTFLSNAALTGSLQISQNLTVQGTASFGYLRSVSGSAKIIGDAFIILNADVPSERYAGLIVIDSGSTGQTGSLLYDAEQDHWFYESTTEGYASGFIAGARATRDNLIYPNRFAITRGDGGNHIVDSNIYSTGSYVTVNRGGTGSKIAEIDIVGSMLITGSTLLPSPDGAVGSKYALVTSQSAWHNNVNIGYPTSNNWQSGLNGSYFNNFNANSDVSEMLRFIAGLLSASAPDASPNTKTYAGISENITNSGTGTPAAGYVPQSSTETSILYLTSKGFTTAGTTLFPGKTIYNSSAYNITYTSTAGGSTIVSSSADAQLFGLGLLTSGGPTQFNVSGALDWFYSDNNSETVTAISASQNLLSNSTFGTTNGLTLGKINTANPAVIPAAYQDGKFAGIFSSNLFNGGRSFTNISSSGWYHISASIRIASGSSPYSAVQSVTERIFWAPLSSISIANNTKAVGYAGFQALTTTSRSLSGAPYLTAATYQVSSSVTGLFNPMYSANVTIARQGATGNVTLTDGGTGASQATINSSGLISSANTIFDSTGVTVRATSTIPFETDLIKLTGSISLNIGTGTNIAQTGLSPTTFTIDTFGRDRSGTEGSTLNTQTILYHTASAFGQPASSGSLAYYGRSQGSDTGTLTGNSEPFTGESNRVQITDKFLSGSYSAADAWVTTFGLYNLGALDLQVKPGFLVRPGGTYRYWLNDPDGTKTYKFYARAFQRSSGTAANNLILNLGTTLVAWDSATSGVAAAILFRSSGVVNFATPRIYDPTQLTSNLINASIANDNQRNPFSRNIALYGNTTGNLASTTYTVPLREADGMILNGTNQDYIVLVRYTGDQAPITSITVSYS
jgi:hypothetical protein